MQNALARHTKHISCSPRLLPAEHAINSGMTPTNRLQAGSSRSAHLPVELLHNGRSSQSGRHTTAPSPSRRGALRHSRRCIAAAGAAETDPQAAPAASGDSPSPIEEIRIHEIGFSRDFHKLYTLAEKIGRGAEGEVFVGVSRRSGDK